MIRPDFIDAMKSGRGSVVIMAGSGSDKDHIVKLTKSLDRYRIPHDVRICSAHKQPDRLSELTREYNAVGGSVTYIAVAGGTDALSGALSWNVLGPVISSPPDAPNQSCLTNPPGSSNAYVPRPENIGRLIAQMYSAVNPELRAQLERENREKVSELEGSDAEFQRLYGERK